jgi:hypothetical protein
MIEPAPPESDPPPPSDDDGYDRLAAFLAENGVAMPKVKSYRSVKAALNAIIREEAERDD